MRATIFKLKKTMAVLPLNGYKVIDASSVLMGPYASQRSEEHTSELQSH